ncbi:MAG TPA: heavy metal sensor histidine kinase [Caulobacteraceae bacterium]|nr:heavy metal sensor histidine kinase [Caulobacteraceae bacterium]
MARRRSASIALRMTLWYALSAFVTVALATGLLYWVLVGSMYREDLRDLADNLNNAELLLPLSSPRTGFAASHQQLPSWSPSHQPEIYLRVLDGAGRTLTETPGMARKLAPPSPSELAAVGAAAGERRDVVTPSGEPFLSLVVRAPGRGADAPARFMQVAMDRGHDQYLLARYRGRLWLVLGVALLSCSLVGYLIARAGMRPIETVGRTAARIRATTLHERIDTGGLPAELDELAGSFNGMLDRLEQSFRHVSQFSDDVAHELRTPVGNLRGEIEVALSRPRSGKAYRDVLESCLEECARLSNLIGTLLFLARSETSAQSLRRESIDVGRELEKVGAYYGALAEEAGIDLAVRPAKGVRAELDRILFQQAIGNLVSNAIAHTPAGGLVSLAAHADRDALTVSVSDTGCGIGAEHLPRVFERFYRVDSARGSSANVGLGLAVVKSIVARHGGRIELASQVGRGTKVTLTLPARSGAAASA